MPAMPRQQGVSLIGALIIMLLIGSAIMTAFRLGPAYVEYYKAQVAMENLASQPGAKEKNPTELRRELLKRLDLDDVDTVKKDNIKVSKEDRVVTVAIDYERRIEFYFNLDVVAKFQYQVVVAEK